MLFCLIFPLFALFPTKKAASQQPFYAFLHFTFYIFDNNNISPILFTVSVPQKIVPLDYTMPYPSGTTQCTRGVRLILCLAFFPFTSSSPQSIGADGCRRSVRGGKRWRVDALAEQPRCVRLLRRGFRPRGKACDGCKEHG